MHGEPEDVDYQFLSAVREPTRPWQRATPPPPEPEAREPDAGDEMLSDPDDVVGALAQWAKDGYEWEDIEARVEEMLTQPRRTVARRPTRTASDEQYEQDSIMRNQWAP